MEQQPGPFVKDFKILRFHGAEGYPGEDVAAREEPLEVRLNGQTLVYLMRLPGDDRLLAAGFLLSEGLVSARDQVELIRHCTDTLADSPDGGESAPAAAGNLVEVTAKLAAGEERFETARVIRTGCGGADLDREVDLAGIEVAPGPEFSPGRIAGLPDRLLAGQEVFKASGGTHGAGLFDNSGEMLVVKEDVGRHNAVDKVLGFMLLSGADPADKGLMLSGRLSYEMVLKAARAGIPLVCSVSAPTALGIEVALATGVTLVGFLRGSSFNVYSHPERIGGG
jgi:FdhD protein